MHLPVFLIVYPLLLIPTRADLNDLIQELVRGQIVDQGPDFLKSSLLKSPLNIFKHIGSLITVPSDANAPINPIKDAQESSAPSNFDEDADPKRYLQALHLASSCSDQGASPILYPWQIFDFKSQLSSALQVPKSCVPPVLCGGHLYSQEEWDNSIFCNRALGNNERVERMGVCCPDEDIFFTPVNNSHFQFLSNTSSHSIKPINPRYLQLLTETTSKAMKTIQSLFLQQEQWKQDGNWKLMSTILDPVQPESRDVGDGGLGLVEVTRSMAAELTGSSSLFRQVPPASLKSTPTSERFCPLSQVAIRCVESTQRYRTVDGSCNNEQDSSIGQVFEALVRLTDSAYEDGVFEARKFSKNGDKLALLPSPRKISSFLSSLQSNRNDDTHSRHNFGFATFAQFVDYDLSQMVFYDLGVSGTKISCTANGKSLESEKLHPMCLNIKVPEDDPFYSALGVKELPFVRSMVSSKKCRFGAAQTLNQVTHWLDLSQIYGSLDHVSNFLREFKGGRLRTFEYNGEDYLMLDPSCNLSTMKGVCAFRTGDLRANQHLYLTMMYTIWGREHNRVAFVLSTIHSEWSDEMLFNEARRIVIAEYQHIIYNELIPSTIGPKFATKFNLLPSFGIGFTEYRSEVDGSVTNEFATAAARIGLSTTPDHIKIISEQKTVSTIAMKDVVDMPLKLIGDGIPDSVIRGMSRMAMRNVDEHFSQDITGKLFEPQNALFVKDILSTTIMRGRDHGLPSYAFVVNALSTYCDLPSIFSFKNLRSLMSQDKVKLLEQLYLNYDDIDLYVGGVLEDHVTGGIVGPTFACIIADQFARSKVGDRFHYQHGGLSNSLTQDQLDQIRRTSMARVYCDNSKSLGEMQPLAFNRISKTNPPLDCSNFDSILTVDLSLWKSGK